mmetsp:Transcript_25308/g.35458  ORF Transcript_25308/g.35458 Transcript_25308/m.35458 type:complete len:544 (+) Transcript_25308:94-1725(+)
MMQDEHQDTINSIFANASTSTHDNGIGSTLFSAANDNSLESSSISESQIAASQYPIEVNIYSWEERNPQPVAPQTTGRPLLDSLRKIKSSVGSSNSFVIYNIEVQRGPHKWKVERRYSEFAQFDQQLHTKFPYLPLPELPPKGSVTSNEDKSQAFLNNRMKSLGEYLSKLVQLPTIRDSEDLRTFLNDETPTPAQQAAQGSDAQVFQAADSQTIKSGQLTLTDMGILNKSKPVWVVLTDIALAYYNDQKDTKVQGFILLTGWGEVKLAETEQTKFSIVTGDKTLSFMASDSEARSQWVSAIQKVLKVSFDLILENSQKVEYDSDDPFLKLKLEPGHCVYAQPSTVLFYEPGIELKAQLAVKDDKSKKRAIGRLVLLGQIFLVQISNDTAETKEVTLSSTSSLLSIDLAEHGGIILCSRETFMCSPIGVDISVGVNNAILGLSGQGIVFQRIVGGTTIHLSVTGSVMEKVLKEGESLIVESGAVVAVEATVKMAAETRFDIVNKVLGGLNMVAVKATGPGKVWIQSITPSRSLTSFSPIKKLLK